SFRVLPSRGNSLTVRRTNDGDQRSLIMRKKSPLLCRFLYLERLEERMAPAVFNVNTTADTVTVNLTTGQDSLGNISLRSAIQAANHLGGTNSINLPAGTYKLTIADTANGTEDNASQGDLDIQNNLTITGALPGPVIVDANLLDRAFQ